MPELQIAATRLRRLARALPRRRAAVATPSLARPALGLQHHALLRVPPPLTVRPRPSIRPAQVRIRPPPLPTALPPGPGPPRPPGSFHRLPTAPCLHLGHQPAVRL